VWQNIYEELKDHGFMVMAVAMDTPEAARPFIEAAKPGYISLIDRDHHVSALFNMVNVPEAVWIDEQGHIVRPAENAGWYEGFRWRNRETGEMPADAAEKTARAKRIYMDAVRDWALKGAASRHALSDVNAQSHLRRPDDNIALAHAHFRLGRYLQRNGHNDDAQKYFHEAKRLHPDSWNIWRQTAGRNENGFAAGPEFYERVDALGERRYYEQVKIEGMP
jgi:tetratricopeptide (TPR) repeat protein